MPVAGARPPELDAAGCPATPACQTAERSPQRASRTQAWGPPGTAGEPGEPAAALCSRSPWAEFWTCLRCVNAGKLLPSLSLFVTWAMEGRVWMMVKWLKPGLRPCDWLLFGVLATEQLRGSTKEWATPEV